MGTAGGRGACLGHGLRARKQLTSSRNRHGVCLELGELGGRSPGIMRERERKRLTQLRPLGVNCLYRPHLSSMKGLPAQMTSPSDLELPGLGSAPHRLHAKYTDAKYLTRLFPRRNAP